MIVLLHPVSGLTYFLTTSQRDELAPPLIETYLQRCPECEHILGPLSWGREKRTHDVVSGAFEFECDYLVKELLFVYRRVRCNMFALFCFSSMSVLCVGLL